jgi:sporulation protein YlmC with PRC-barrel domain
LTLDELDDFMNSTKISFVLPENVITNQGTRDLVADIPWDAINKIGDVVLLKSTLTDLRSKGYIQGL